MYPTYALEQFVPISGEWVPIEGYPADDRPHHYDWLRKAFEKFVTRAKKEGGSIGYRITVAHQPSGREPVVVDLWEQDCGPELTLRVVAGILGPNGPDSAIEARVLAYNRAAKDLGWPTWGNARR